MSDLAVDFDWYRSDYDFVAPTNPPSVPISKAYIDKPWALEPWIEEERETGALFGKIVARGPTKKIHPDAHRLSVALRALTTIKRNTFDETLFEFRVAVPTIARALGMLDHVSEPGETETLMDWFYLAQTLRNILRIGKKSSASEKK